MTGPEEVTGPLEVIGSAEVTGPPEVAGPAAERRARVALSFLAEPGDAVLGAALRSRSAAGILAAVTGADSSGQIALAAGPEDPALSAALRKWRGRLGLVPPVSRLAAWQQGGLRVVCPGDPEWPTQLDDLGDARPLLLWMRGSADLRYSCLRSVSIVGARAATGYGTHVGLELGAALAERGLSVISGGA
jgi:DNA processing protein